MKSSKMLMTMLGLACASASWAAMPRMPTTMPTMDAMRWHNRVLLIATPDGHDGKAQQQRAVLSQWWKEAADRDIALVEVVGSRVTGTADSGPALNRRYGLSGKPFAVLLIGKDGHVALRSTDPIPAERLQTVIDAMPMRRAGQR